MKQGIFGLVLALIASAALAGQPVTITNPSNSQAANVDTTTPGTSEPGVVVRCIGCSSGSFTGAVTMASGAVASGAYSTGWDADCTASPTTYSLCYWASQIYTGVTTAISGQSSHGVNIGGVEGLAAIGASTAQYPDVVGGLASGESGNVEAWKVDISGNGYVDVTNTITSSPVAAATGGATPVSILSANSTNATNVKASAGTLYHISLQNDSTSALAYAIFFNSAGTPTCTGTPYYGPILIPYVGSTGNNGSGVIEDIAIGLNFSTGIAYCLTTAPGGTGSVAANQVSGGLGYK